MKFKILFVALLGMILISANTTEEASADYTVSPSVAEEQWVDSIFAVMSPEERLGQLFMIRAHSDKGPDHIAKVKKLIKKYQVGGLCFFQGTPEKQVELTNRYQLLTKHIPMMIAMDAEWGLGMRFKEDGISFPRQLMLGAIQDNRLLYDMGKEIARQSERIGVHINFAPVADVNNNPENPVINTRSFGEDRYNVAVKSYMYMRGMQDHNLMACAKHFPGHGDTDLDSHYDLPIIAHSQSRLDSIELFPFRVLAQHGIQSMMVAHLSVPALDDRENRPTTLSRGTVTNLLQEKFGFSGLIFTDGLGMKGVTKHYKPGEVEAEALLAGNDVLLLPEDVGAAVKAIKAYVKSGKLSQAEIDQSVKKVLRAKYRLKLTHIKQLSESNVRAEVNTENAKALKRKLIKHALTMVRNPNDLIPFQRLDTMEMASLSIGSTKRTAFQNTLGRYDAMTHFNVGKEITVSKSKQLIQKLKKYDAVIVGLHDMSSYAKKKFGISQSARRFLDALRKETKVILTVFGNPYSLAYFDDFEWVVEAYEEGPMAEDLAAQALFGAFSMQGRLPVTASARSRFNDGVNTQDLFRLGYGLPEEVNMDSKVLNTIDALAKDAIAQKATPGCVVLVVKDGQVVFDKAYGYHTYKKLKRISNNDLFDLASVTKVAATTMSMMKLYDEGAVNIYQPMSTYLSPLKGTNKENIVLEDVMAHRAGLHPWIPFYEQTITSSKRNPRPQSKYYAKSPTSKYIIPVADRLYMEEDFVQEMKKQIHDSELLSHRNYKYSDLGFYLLSDLVEEQSGQRLDDYVQATFYKKLGLSTATFNPWKNFPKSRIVPTEEDRYFRRQRVHGYVHDMGAAMLGGVSGHAGLFANANDLAVLMQLILNEGYYGGDRFFSPQTVRTFTNRHSSCTRRGIGFDMKELDSTRSQNMCASASANTFGHLGFTGICTWVDPDQNLIYIFLSNRTYPSMHNYKLNKEDFRPRIQEIIYESIR